MSPSASPGQRLGWHHWIAITPATSCNEDRNLCGLSVIPMGREYGVWRLTGQTMSTLRFLPAPTVNIVCKSSYGESGSEEDIWSPHHSPTIYWQGDWSWRIFQVLPTFIVCILDGYVAPFKFRVKREAVELDVCVFVILISRWNVLVQRQACPHGGAVRGFRDDHHLWMDHVSITSIFSFEVVRPGN